MLVRVYNPTVHVICKELFYSLMSKVNRSLHLSLHEVYILSYLITSHVPEPADLLFTALEEHDHL